MYRSGTVLARIISQTVFEGRNRNPDSAESSDKVSSDHRVQSQRDAEFAKVSNMDWQRGRPNRAENTHEDVFETFPFVKAKKHQRRG